MVSVAEAIARRGCAQRPPSQKWSTLSPTTKEMMRGIGQPGEAAQCWSFSLARYTSVRELTGTVNIIIIQDAAVRTSWAYRDEIDPPVDSGGDQILAFNCCIQ